MKVLEVSQIKAKNEWKLNKIYSSICDLAAFHNLNILKVDLTKLLIFNGVTHFLFSFVSNATI